MKKYILPAVLIVMFAVSAKANSQTEEPRGPDHWETADLCIMAALAATPEKPAIPYYPSILRKRALSKGEFTGGLPAKSCVEMELPDRLTDDGWGWVIIGEDRKVVFGPNGEVRRLEECNNDIRAVVPIPFPTAKGEKGDKGEDGLDGINCWDLNNNGMNDPNEDANGDGAFNSGDCRGKNGKDGDDCDIYKTRGFFLHHTFKQCGDEKAQVIGRGLRGWVIPTVGLLGAAAGGVAAAPLCVTLESAVAIGALSGVTAATATNVVVQDLPAPSRTINDIVNNQ